MRDVAQRVEDEMVEAFEQRLGAFRDCAEIRQVGGVAKAEAEHLAWAVHCWDRNNFYAEERERTFDLVQFNARKRAVSRLIVEDVGERSLQYLQRCFRGVDGNGGFLFQIVGADIVEAENMIGMGVSVENCVEAIEVRGHGLGTEVGRGVDDDVASAIREQHGRARALVVRIV